MQDPQNDSFLEPREHEGVNYLRDENPDCDNSHSQNTPRLPFPCPYSRAHAHRQHMAQLPFPFLCHCLCLCPFPQIQSQFLLLLLEKLEDFPTTRISQHVETHHSKHIAIIDCSLHILHYLASLETHPLTLFHICHQNSLSRNFPSFQRRTRTFRIEKLLIEIIIWRPAQSFKRKGFF